MTIIDTTSLWTGRLGKKTKGLKAMPMRVCLFAAAAPFFKLSTLEGMAEPDLNAHLCVGEAGEPWQQLPAKLEKDYEHAGTEGPWSLYTPRPTKVVEFIEVTPELVATLPGGIAAPLFIIGKWGQTIDGIDNLQRLHVGDFIARQVDEHADQWVVQRSIWQRTYEEVFKK